MGDVMGEPWRPQDVDLGFPGWGGYVGVRVSQAGPPPGDWEDPVLGFPIPLTGAGVGESRRGV